jgi:hypothetical protein
VNVRVITNRSPEFLRAMREWEQDSLPELPPPRDYAEYERQKRAQDGLGELARYLEPAA